MANSNWANEAFGPVHTPQPSPDPRPVQGVKRHAWPHLHPATELREAFANHGGRLWVDEYETAKAQAEVDAAHLALHYPTAQDL